MADCSGWIEPLNLECLLVNTFAGSMELFVFLAVIFIASVGAYFRMMNATILLMFGIFAVIMATQLQGIYFLALLIAGLIASFAVGRIVKQ
jgi:hypothetical protein|tara:strand:+ start:430 stop:702 length:273 start_codon:yes stop_codon:yes gene_type:complete